MAGGAPAVCAEPAVEDPAVEGSAVGESTLTRATWALEGAGDLRVSRVLFDAAYLDAERAGDARAMAEAAVGLAGLWPDQHRTAAGWAGLLARLRQALARLDAGGTLALRVRVRLAAEQDYRAGEHSRILGVLEETRYAGDLAVRAEALRLAHHCVLGPDHARLRRELAEELVGVAACGAGRVHLLSGLLAQLVNLLLEGHRLARRRLGELRAELDRQDHLAIRYAVDAVEVMLAVRSGRLAEAERLAAEAYERGRRAGVVDATAWHALQLVAIRWYQDRLPELVPLLAGLVDSAQLSTTDSAVAAAHMLAAASAGDQRVAMQGMAMLRRPVFAGAPHSAGWLFAAAALVETARLTGDATAAARAGALLAGHADLPVAPGLGVACFGSVHGVLGAAALTTGDLDGAVDHLRQACYRDLALGHWPATLRSGALLADVLDRRGAPGDAAQARRYREVGAEVAAELRGGGTEDGGTEEAPAAAWQPAGPATCGRYGRLWRVELDGRAVHVGHGVGMLHLAVLIANPGTEITAFDLVSGMTAVRRAAGGGLSRQAILDRTAVAGYRRRLAQLRDAPADPGPADPEPGHRDERDWLSGELAANTRPGRPARAFGDEAERARVAAGRAIRRALAAVERADPVIGAHLRAAVHTGARCWYRPV